jgi:hypothetical protein
MQIGEQLQLYYQLPILHSQVSGTEQETIVIITKLMY